MYCLYQHYLYLGLTGIQWDFLIVETLLSLTIKSRLNRRRQHSCKKLVFSVLLTRSLLLTWGHLKWSQFTDWILWSISACSWEAVLKVKCEGGCRCEHLGCSVKCKQHTLCLSVAQKHCGHRREDNIIYTIEHTSRDYTWTHLCLTLL